MLHCSSSSPARILTNMERRNHLKSAVAVVVLSCSCCCLAGWTRGKNKAKGDAVEQSIIGWWLPHQGMEDQQKSEEHSEEGSNKAKSSSVRGRDTTTIYYY
mmetsp:Transcript_17133/g.47126  ORF Transcript_17133/g.47126 Transcript_17133/m.47126 type:complete len:101 (-) Transcript_17133:31-333(-)